MQLTKKRKFTVSILLVLALLAVLAFFQPWKRASQEMIALRLIEQKLSLPAPMDRSEQDIGENKDWKGAHHNTRYILLYYDDLSKVDSIRHTLEVSGWKEVEKSNYEQSATYKYTHISNQACVSVLTNPASSDSLPHAVFIGSATDDACSRYFK